MTLPPSADHITVREVLTKLETEFAPVSQAIGNGEFAFWVGSGISRQAPNLGNLIERAFDYIRERAIDPATAGQYLPALEEALALAEVLPATVNAQYGQPLAAWLQHDAIIDRLWNKYSRVLDIRIGGTETDFVLWEAINIRQAFAHPEPPAAEHLCIAILILEGAVQAIASANWDGFIEAAVERLSGGVAGVMQVVVDPSQFRGPVARAKLLKFHGCIVQATSDPALYRRFLTGSHTQIMDWPERADFAAMRNAIVGLATTQKTLVLGLSIQDNNLQTIFARAKEAHGWPWPCAPDAPAHIFCENAIQQGQRDVLRLTYGEAYNIDPSSLHSATLLRAWGENVLIALVLKLLTDKLTRLMQLTLATVGKEFIAGELETSLKELRNYISDLALPIPGRQSRTSFVNSAISIWSRMLSLFRGGVLPVDADAYEALSNLALNLIPTDQNAQATGLGRLSIALSLLQYGRAAGVWELRQPLANTITSGAIATRALHAGGLSRPLFVVKSATEAISLQSIGALANGDAIIVHADDTWHRMIRGGVSARSVSASPGRTGRVGETHVSLGDLLVRCVDTATLQKEFIAEMML